MGTHRRIDNSAARRLFLDRHGLIAPPFHKDLPGLIHDLGFVQVDSVNTLARAHDLILWSRRQAYRPAHMDRMLKQRRVFEHWTHDASVVPMEFFPQWRLKFARDKARCDSNWDKWRREGFREKFGTVLEQIAAHGPVTSAQVGEDEAKGSQGWWDWHPSKAALEYLWRAG